MLDYSDVPEWLLEQHPQDGFVDALLDQTAAVVERLADSRIPLRALALEIKPADDFIELSLLFDPAIEDVSRIETWDRYLATRDQTFIDLWQPVRAAFKPERWKWDNLRSAHPKGGSLYIFTILVCFVSNLDTGPIADVFDRVSTARDLHIFAVNYDDPNLPNIFEVEHHRTTLRDLTPVPTCRREEPREEPGEPEVDSNQLELF